MNASKALLSVLSISLTLLVSGCGGGGDSTATPTSAGLNSVAAAVSASAPVSSCRNGGVQVDTGIDTNGNGVLDVAEITNTQYVCNGDTGSSGLSTLVAISNEAAGANCANGGDKVDAGLDTDGSGVLDITEVTTTSYICNGADGSNGTNGLNSLVAAVPEPAGTFCTYGGNKVSNGLDSNANDILDSSEISASYYVCDGAPGATGPAGSGVTWQDVTASSVQAVSNTGYLANNATTQVTITLPTAPVYGDLVQVTGVGAGGWKIAQNAGQTTITGYIANYLDSWTQRGSFGNWQAIASSADGSKLVAADYGGQLYTSADYGLTWTPRDAARNWTAVASSSDGSKLVAAVDGGQLYTSTDSGVTWTPRESNRGWDTVASSADGSMLVAGDFGGQLYTSSDSGVTWTPRDSARSWASVASSADGSKLVAADFGGQLYTSTDFGVNWTPRQAGLNWISVASSADGSKLVAAEFGGLLYTSTDSGVTWSARKSAPAWRSVASSADGSKLVAADFGTSPTEPGHLYTSTDSGLTWTPRNGLGNWGAVASSADGNKLVAVDGANIYTTMNSTLPGPAGSISGNQYDSIDLQYIGNDTFVVRGYVGYLVVQ